MYTLQPAVSVLFFKDQRRTSETKLVARCRLSSVEDGGTDPGLMFIKSKQKKGKLVFRFFIFIFQISQHFSAGTHIDSHFGLQRKSYTQCHFGGFHEYSPGQKFASSTS